MKTYSPQTLWTRTLRLLNVIFRHPPNVEVDPVSYFQAVLTMHDFIRNDLDGTFVPAPTVPPPSATIELISHSLTALEKMLFDTSHPFAPTVEGCCLYTDYLERTLSRSRTTCRLL